MSDRDNEFDRRMRDGLQGLAGDLHPTGTYADVRRRHARRRTARLAASAAALALAGGLAAGITLTERSTAATYRLIPVAPPSVGDGGPTTTSTTPTTEDPIFIPAFEVHGTIEGKLYGTTNGSGSTTPPAPQTMSAVPPCNPAQVTLKTSFNGGDGGLIGSVFFTNVGPGACFLSGRPIVQLTGANGEALAIIDEPGGRAPTSGAPPTGPIVLDAGGGPHQAGAPLEWNNWCGSPGNVGSVRVTFGQPATTSEAPVSNGPGTDSAFPGCNNPSGQPIIYVDYIRAFSPQGGYG
jgi:hypothetical protein